MLAQALSQSHAIFETNLTGVINTLDPVIPAMLARKAGQMVIISSLAGFAAWPGAPAYSASKAAVRYYGLALRARLAKEGVRVSVVCPGFVESRLTAQNPFPMPFLMTAPKAARLIARRLESNPPLVVFPFATALVSRVLGLLPPSLAALLLTRVPQKNALQNDPE